MYIRPTHKDLMGDNPEDNYFKRYIDYYINKTDTASTYVTAIRQLYSAAQGDIDEDEYDYVLNPTNTKNAALKRLPGRLRNYDIIGPVIKLFMGDFATRPNDAIVYYSGGSDSTFDRQRDIFLQNHLAQSFINALNEIGFDTGVESVQQASVQEDLEKFKKQYRNLRTEIGWQALDYIKNNLMLNEKLQLLFYDWVVAGTVATYKTIRNDDVEYYVLPPDCVIPFGVPENGCFEDAEAVVAILPLTLSEIVDRCDLTEEELTKLESESGFSTESTSIDHFTDSNTTNTYARRIMAYSDTTKYNLYIVNWKGQAVVGTLTYVNPVTGTIEEREVDSSYKLNKAMGDIEIEWYIRDIAYSGERIGKYIYKNIGEIEVQRTKFDGNGTRLAFNGKMRGFRTGKIQSEVADGLVYQQLYNILHLRYEVLIAASKDKMVTFPWGLIPRNKDMDEAKWFYWSNVHKFMFYDESKPNAQTALQGIKEIDLSFRNSIDGMQAAIERVRYEYWSVIGLNPQRFGETTASDGLGVNQQAMNRSAIISLSTFMQFDQFMAREYQGFLDISKYAWRNGKKAAYLSGEGREMIFELDPIEYAESEYGVFARNTADDKDKLEQVRQAMITLSSAGGVKIDGVTDIILSKDVGSLRELAADYVKAERDFLSGLEAQKAQQAQELELVKERTAKLKSQDTRFQALMTYRAYVDAAAIKAGVDIQGLIQNTAEAVDQFGDFALDETNDALLKKAHQDMVVNELARMQEKASLDREKMRSAETIAKQNKNKYDS